MRIKPKDWSSFQHYKERSPTWIKFHRALLDDFEFQGLPVASRALAPMLWLLASEHEDGIIEASEQKLAFRLRMAEQELLDALKPLLDTGFFEDASKPLARRKRPASTALAIERSAASAALAGGKHAASPEKEEETETETETESESEGESEKETEESASASADDDIVLAVEAYNDLAKDCDWPIAQNLTTVRRGKLAARLAEAGGLEGWRAAMAKARASPFLRGETRRDRAHASWTPDLDFFVKQSAFTKLMEGRYDERDRRAEPDGFAAVVAGARAAASL